LYFGSPSAERGKTRASAKIGTFTFPNKNEKMNAEKLMTHALRAALPRVGMLATVRNRRGVISAVEPFAAAQNLQLLHMVTIEFSDSDGDAEETLLWERERQPVVLEPNALPRIDGDAPMRMREFLALQRATRWTAITPFLSADRPETRRASAHGAGLRRGQC
jgi:hypothetical protein